MVYTKLANSNLVLLLRICMEFFNFIFKKGRINAQKYAELKLLCRRQSREIH